METREGPVGSQHGPALIFMSVYVSVFGEGQVVPVLAIAAMSFSCFLFYFCLRLLLVMYVV